MARVVGNLNRSPYIVDPAAALEAGRRVDSLLSSSNMPHPRGVFRAKHEVLNEMDDRRQLRAALRVADGSRDG